jgi:hypothetical protein
MICVHRVKERKERKQGSLPDTYPLDDKGREGYSQNSNF